MDVGGAGVVMPPPGLDPPPPPHALKTIQAAAANSGKACLRIFSPHVRYKDDITDCKWAEDRVFRSEKLFFALIIRGGDMGVKRSSFDPQYRRKR